MNAGLTRRGMARTRPKGRALLAIMVIVVAALLLPLGYVFERYWASIGSAATTVSAERDGVTYVRPVARLLAALVNAQSAAVRGAPADPAGIRGAVQNVNRVDQDSGDPLWIRPRWAQLATQIESTVNQPPGTGQDALRAYAVPIGLTQALLSRIGDASGMVRDPDPDAYHLIDTALLRVPDVMINAETIAGLARTTGTPVAPAIAVAADRMARSAEAVGVGLRMENNATTPGNVDIDLLKPLDEFAAAVGALAQASSEVSAGTPRTELDAAAARVQKGAVALQTAAFDGFELVLNRRSGSLTAQRGAAGVAGMLGLLAAGVLLWLSQRAGRRAAKPSTVDPSGRPDERDRLARLESTNDLVNARDLLTPELVHGGHPRSAKAGPR